jgi:hypothetical protein
MVAEPDHRRVIVPVRLRRIAAETLSARRPAREAHGARSRVVGRTSDGAVVRRPVMARRGLGEFGGYGS